MKQSGRRIAAVVLALVLAAAGMAGCRISRTRTMTDKERMACEAYTISFPEEVLGDKTLAETILSLCTAQEETEYGTVYDGAALQPYLYQCSEVTEVVSSMDRPMHLNVRYKTQDDIEASLEIDYDVIVLRSVYYPDEDAYALEQMGKAVWMTISGMEARRAEWKSLNSEILSRNLTPSPARSAESPCAAGCSRAAVSCISPIRRSTGSTGR